MASIAQVTVRFGADIKDLSSKMQRANKEVLALGRTMQSTGRNLTQKLTLPLLAAGGASAKLAFDFDESMTKIQTLVGLSEDTVASFREEVIQLAGRTAQAPAVLADALFTVTSAGLRGAEAMQVLEAAAKGSAVGMGETKEIARAVTAAMQAYGPEVLSAAQAMDILTVTVREGNLEASELAPVLGRVIGLAAQLGVSFDEVGASIATFTRLGVDSSEAVTGLTGILNALIKPSVEGGKALATVGMTFKDLRREVDQNGLAQTLIKLLATFKGNEEALSDIIPNVRAFSTMLGTAGSQGEEYLRINESIRNSLGATDKAFQDTTKSASFLVKDALNELKTVGTQIGSIVLPVVADLAKEVKALFERFRNLNPETQTTIVKVAALAAATGPLIYGVGTLITSFGGLLKTLRTVGSFLATNPWFALAGAVVAVGTALWGYHEATKAVEKAQVSQRQKVEEEKQGLNTLVNTITRLNEDNEARLALIEELRQKYPDFISKLGNEELTNKNLQTALKAVNEEYVKKIALAAAEDGLTENLRQQKGLFDEIVQMQKDMTKAQEDLMKADSTQSQTEIKNRIEGYQAGIELNQMFLEQLREEAKETQKTYEELAQAITTVSAPKVETAGRGGTGVAITPFTGQLAEMKELLPLVGEVKGSIENLGISTNGTFTEMDKGFSLLDSGFSGVGDVVTGVFNDMLNGSKITLKSIVADIGKLILRLTIAAGAAAALRAILGDPTAASSGASAAKGIASVLSSLVSNFGGFRAEGGPVQAGKDYIVGERGMEVFRPSSNGTIIPNHALSAGGGKMQLEFVGSIPLRWDGQGVTGMITQENIRIKRFGG